MTRTQRRPSGLTAVHIRKATSALLVASGLVALVACGGSDSSGSAKKSPSVGNSTSAPATSSASADPEAGAKTDVLKAYGRFWDEQVKAYGQADIKGTDLKKYATKEALGRAMGDVLVMKNSRHTHQGRPDTRLAGDRPVAHRQDPASQPA